MTDTISIGELAELTRDAIQRQGLAVHSVWAAYCDTLLPMLILKQPLSMLTRIPSRNDEQSKQPHPAITH